MEICNLIDTVGLMGSSDYKERFQAEYYQLMIRIEKLEVFLGKIYKAQEEGTEEPAHDCPVSLLEKQLQIMIQYADVLKSRAAIEKVVLS